MHWGVMLTSAETNKPVYVQARSVMMVEAKLNADDPGTSVLVFDTCILAVTETPEEVVKLLDQAVANEGGQ